jgi:hypothetical protein
MEIPVEAVSVRSGAGVEPVLTVSNVGIYK